jgi:hypothetical protein
MGCQHTNRHTDFPPRAPPRVNAPGCSRAPVGSRRQYPLPREWDEGYINEKDKNRLRIKLQHDAATVSRVSNGDYN